MPNDVVLLKEDPHVGPTRIRAETRFNPRWPVFVVDHDVAPSQPSSLHTLIKTFRAAYFDLGQGDFCWLWLFIFLNTRKISKKFRKILKIQRNKKGIFGEKKIFESFYFQLPVISIRVQLYIRHLDKFWICPIRYFIRSFKYLYYVFIIIIFINCLKLKNMYML